VTPLALRVETVAGYSDVVLDANTPVPCDKARTFTTAQDKQTTVVVRVAQGNVERFAENTFLGELELSGIAEAPRGEPRIRVTFEINADGMLQVKARDETTGVETTAKMQLVGATQDPNSLLAMRARVAGKRLVDAGDGP
jgi:molecular chaperone DnaK